MISFLIKNLPNFFKDFYSLQDITLLSHYNVQYFFLSLFFFFKFSGLNKNDQLIIKRTEVALLSSETSFEELHGILYSFFSTNIILIWSSILQVHDERYNGSCENSYLFRARKSTISLSLLKNTRRT